jgi:hypothetical protein
MRKGGHVDAGEAILLGLARRPWLPSRMSLERERVLAAAPGRVILIAARAGIRNAWTD